MSLILIERIANLNGPIIPDTLNGVLNGGEIDAHKFIVTATRDGATVALTGTVTASFLSADGAEVVLTGEIENGAATVTLAQSCYAVPGRFDLTIFVTSDGVKTGVYACTGGVRNTTSGTIVDPGHIVPSVEQVIAKQKELAQDVANASSAIESAQNAVSYLAPVFSASKTYKVGEYVTKDGALYICTTAVETAGAWDVANWQAVTFGEEVTGLNSALGKISEKSINLMPIGSLSSMVNGVNVDYENGIITRIGTATVDGGRLIHITPTFTLTAGTYVFWISTTGATLFIENASTNAIIATAINNAVAQFTLTEDTIVYIGTNMVSGTTYNDSYEVQIEQGSAKTEFQSPDILTAFDEVAREKSNLAFDFGINNAFSAFMKFGVIGDSLAVGYTGDGVSERNPEYSWGRILARRLGNICQLFAKAGTTTKNWFTDPYCYSELIIPDNKCQAYIIGIGTNDVISTSFPIGTIADINLSDSSLNADSFCGWYGKIIQAIIGVNSTAKIFVFTIPYPRVDNAKNNAIRAISELFDNVFLVDLADEYNDLFMADAVTDFAVNSHFSSGGYANLAVINNYILSLTIKNNASDFIDIPHIPYGSADDVI